MDVVYAVDGRGDRSHTEVLESTVEGMEASTLREAIAEFGLEAVAQQFLRTLVDDGTVHADAAAAEADAVRIADVDPEADPRVHELSVADVADLFTRIGLTDPP